LARRNWFGQLDLDIRTGSGLRSSMLGTWASEASVDPEEAVEPLVIEDYSSRATGS
jgi:hypothetical protein